MPSRSSPKWEKNKKHDCFISIDKMTYSWTSWAARLRRAIHVRKIKIKKPFLSDLAGLPAFVGDSCMKKKKKKKNFFA
jgi:hypothetical protein